MHDTLDLIFAKINEINERLITLENEIPKELIVSISGTKSHLWNKYRDMITLLDRVTIEHKQYGLITNEIVTRLPLGEYRITDNYHIIRVERQEYRLLRNNDAVISEINNKNNKLSNKYTDNIFVDDRITFTDSNGNNIIKIFKNGKNFGFKDIFEKQVSAIERMTYFDI